MNAEPFTGFFSRHGLLYMVIADVLSGQRYALGSPEGLTRNGLVNLTADLETLDRSLSGQILPTSYRQGREACFIMKPSPDVIAVLYFEPARDFFEEIQWGKDMDHELRQLVGQAG
jgi:hypothetical protein